MVDIMNKIKLFILPFIVLILVSILAYTGYKKMNEIEINIKNDITVELFSEHMISDFVDSVQNGTLKNGEEVIAFNELGEKTVVAKFIDKYSKEYDKKIVIIVVDKEKPEITFNKKITITQGDKIDLLKGVKVKDNSNEDIIPEVVGTYDVNKPGTYRLEYQATDQSGNTSIESFELVVKEKVVAPASNKKYYIKVNKTLNVVMIYSKDGNNEYTNLVKTFVASAGENTPLGIFKTDAKAETLSLVGGVWGHYTVRFMKSRGMWFHSVPYFSKPVNGHWNDLEYEEYNKLGSLASLGCIRLSTIDAKWIYDNISNGTIVEIYESDSLPEGVNKPVPITIDVNSENKGWDPTDPDSNNPWNM